MTPEIDDLTLSQIGNAAVALDVSAVELAILLARHNEDERWVTAEELAAHLRTSTQSIRAWVKEGRISGFKPGKLWLFKISEVEAALSARRDEPKPIQSPQSRGRKRLPA